MLQGNGERKEWILKWMDFFFNIPRVGNFLGSSNGKESACSVGNSGLIPGLGRSPGERHGNPLPYSCLENPMDREAWQATVHGVAKRQTQLSY